MLRRNKADDEKRKELVEARNRADALIHQTRKSLKDLGDSFDATEKANIESAIAGLETVLKDNSVQKSRQRIKVKS